MKAFLRLSSLFLIVLILILALFNISNIISIETGFLSLKVNVGLLILFCAIASSFATLSLINSSDKSTLDKNRLKKLLDSEKLNYEAESDRIKQLMAKIDTLEEALKKYIRT